MKLSITEHGDDVKQRLAEGQTYRQIGEAIGCNHMTVSAFVRVNFPDLRRASTPAVSVTGPATERAPRPEQPTKEELMAAELAELRSRDKKHRSVDVQAERLVQLVREQVLPADVTYEAPDAAEGGGKAHMQVLLLSDLHVGEVVIPEAVNGLNEYNWQIFTERMESMQRALFSFQNNRPYPIDELVIALLGDNVSNNHHKELEATNEFPITEQCYRVGLFLAKWIEALVPHYPKIRVVGVGGNHGRVDKNPSSKYVFDSFDWLGYQYIAQYLSNYDTVECDFPRAGMLVTEVAGRNMLVWHGDGVRSQMPGVPWGGMTRRANELKKQYSEQGVTIDYVAYGHFHTAHVLQGRQFGNGSLMGLTEWSLKNFGSGEKPTQLLLTFNREKRRLTDVSFITPSS